MAATTPASPADRASPAGDKVDPKVIKSSVTSHRGNLTAAFNIAFWWSVGFAVIAAALSLWLPRRHRPASPLAPASRRVNGTTVSGAERS
jgi:hypothetical protein